MWKRMRVMVVAMSMLAGIALPIRQITVYAHAKFERAEPAPGSTLRTPPPLVRIRFTLAPEESLDAQRSTIAVTDARGRRVDDGKGGVDLDDLDRRTLIARLKPLGAGTYTVRWKAVTTPDAGVAQGSFQFSVARAGAVLKLPPLRLVSPKNGATITNPVTVVFETPADLSKMTMGAPGGKATHGAQTAKHGQGMEVMPMVHLHIDLDRRVTMPTMKHLTMVGPNRYKLVLGNTSPGRHTIRLYWGDNKTHRPVGRIVQVSVTVK